MFEFLLFAALSGIFGYHLGSNSIEEPEDCSCVIDDEEEPAQGPIDDIPNDIYWDR